MSTITLTRENFISQIPKLYKMVERSEKLTVTDTKTKESQYEIAMEDLHNGVNVVDFNDYLAKR